MSQRRFELTDFEWSIIEPLLPNTPRGVPRVDDRRVLNGIFWRLRTGSPWADIPERYGPYTTCYNRFVRWTKLGGVGPDIRRGVRGLRGFRAVGRQVFQPCPPARGERKKGGEAPAGTTRVADLRACCMGRSRGGLTTKIHAVTDARGLPITLKLTAGQAHDGRSADDMLGTIGRGQALLADAACDSNRLRDRLADIGAKAVIRRECHEVCVSGLAHAGFRYGHALNRSLNMIANWFRAANHSRTFLPPFSKLRIAR